jgi:ATP-dependent protease HslVU (ClpYQ) ATPase subunit
MTILAEKVYQFLFISSIIFIIYILSDLIIKVYGRFALKQENVTFILNNTEKIMLWASIAMFFTYIL